MPLMSLFSSLLSDVSSWVLVVVGIGMVIFVHELGHFLVAKRCGVRCDVFSLGFGPRLFGFRRDETDYRVSAVPIGGYVKMAGDQPGEAGAADEGSLLSKTVGQRFAIYSAGVVMNVIFSLIVLPIVLAVGVPFHSTVIGAVEPGSPAWLAGMQAGDEIVEIDGSAIVKFDDIVYEVALGDKDHLPVSYRRPGDEEVRAVVLDPTYSEQLGVHVIGVGTSYEEEYAVTAGGPLAQAFAETLGGAETPSYVRPIAIDGKPVDSVGAFFRIARYQLAETAQVELELTDGSRHVLTVRPGTLQEPTRRVGIQPVSNRVLGLRGSALAQPDFLELEDEVHGVWKTEVPLTSIAQAAAAPTHFHPARNADELRALLEPKWRDDGNHYTLEVKRDDALVLLPLGQGEVDATSAAPTGIRGRVTDVDAFLNDIALGLGPQQTRIWLLGTKAENMPARKAGLPDGSVLSAETCMRTFPFLTAVASESVESWNDIIEQIQEHAEKDVALTLAYEATDGKKGSKDVLPQEVQYRPDFGMAPIKAMVERRYGLGEAIQVGAAESMSMLKSVYLTLKKIFTRDVSPKNLSGIITIAAVSKNLADSGVPRLFFFLAILSLNLAFLNILPIPVLDGGHLLFLIVEKIKGSPVSERILGYSQLVGLVMVFALLLYVTYNDIVRVFLS